MKTKSLMENLFLVDRIDCEDESAGNTPIEQLVPRFLEMKSQGFTMPTLRVWCAGTMPEQSRDVKEK
ncbi:MAG: hypothetical protein KAV00_11355, partial [Phycisphaerae bacterium]|nr:hypothetical protein [Phycisphaerae bacterium]